jgi:Fe-Mn family superoxide dismutase
MAMTRRKALVTLSAGGAAALWGPPGRSSMSQAQHPPPSSGQLAPGVPPGRHPVVPLPFDPTKLRGLSERLLVSHHDNNYAGAVNNLNRVEEALAQTGKDTPAYLVSGLKQRELTYTNSVILHEAYFANLGGDGRPAGAIQAALGDAWGSLSRWEEQFRATGMSLGGGSGWAILDFNFHTGDLRAYWAGDHTQSVASGLPLLVLDMYEHSYQMDYGAAVAGYIDAFFRNIHWDEVNRRLERARRAAAALRG